MTILPYMILIWSGFTACFVALLVYRGTLTRYEEDQLFLSENGLPHEQQRQANIVRKINRMQPLVRALGGSSVLLGVVIITMYTWDAWLRLH